MKIQLDLIWERDLSVNSYRFGRPAPGQKFRVRKPHVQAWHNRAVQEIRLAMQRAHCDETGRALAWHMIPKPEIPVYITIGFRWPDKRKRDCGNYRKVIEDAVKVAIGIDDQHFRVTDGDVTIDAENPGFTIRVSDDEAG